MNTVPNKPSMPSSPAVELVNKLIEKTKQNKLEWIYTGPVLATRVSDDVQARFNVSRGYNGELVWSRFTVHSEGDLILEYDNPVGFNNLIAAAMASINPL